VDLQTLAVAAKHP